MVVLESRAPHQLLRLALLSLLEVADCVVVNGVLVTDGARRMGETILTALVQTDTCTLCNQKVTKNFQDGAEQVLLLGQILLFGGGRGSYPRFVDL